MLNHAKLRFALHESGARKSPDGERYTAIGLGIALGDGKREYMLTLPIDPPAPMTTSHEQLIALGMKSLRYLCAHLPPEEA